MKSIDSMGYVNAPISVFLFNKKGESISTIRFARHILIQYGSHLYRYDVSPKLSSRIVELRLSRLLVQLEFDYFNKVYFPRLLREDRKKRAKYLRDIRFEVEPRKAEREIELLTDSHGNAYPKEVYYKKVKTNSKEYKKKYYSYNVTVAKGLKKSKSGKVLGVNVSFEHGVKITRENYKYVMNEIKDMVYPHFLKALENLPRDGVATYFVRLFFKPLEWEEDGHIVVESFKRDEGEAYSFPAKIYKNEKSLNRYMNDIFHGGDFNFKMHQYIVNFEREGYLIDGCDLRITYNYGKRLGTKEYYKFRLKNNKRLYIELTKMTDRKIAALDRASRRENLRLGRGVKKSKKKKTKKARQKKRTR